jgi:hypothetical protein
MGTVYRHGAEPLLFVLASGDDEHSACLISAQLRQVLNLDVVDWQGGEQRYTP